MSRPRVYLRCPECVRHFVSVKVAEKYDGCCNVCGAVLPPKEARR